MKQHGSLCSATLLILVLTALASCSTPEPKPQLQNSPSVALRATPSSPGKPATTAPVSTLGSTDTQPVLVPFSTHALSTTGPYFAHLREENGAYSVVISDLLLGGQAAFPLPHDVADQIKYDTGVRNPVVHISSDSKFYAYEVGDVDPPYDLELHVVRLENQQLVASIPLMRNEMSLALSELATQAASDLAVELSDEPEDIWQEELLFSLQAGIRTFEWSPVQPLLAFVGQIDGPSSDLYVLDPSDPTPRRLTSGLRNVQRLQWSPNGQWIAHSAAYSVGMASPLRNYIAAKDGATNLELPQGGLQAPGWLTSDWYMVNEASNGPGRFDLKAVRLPNSTFTTLWGGTFSSFALDLETSTLVVSVDEPWTYGVERGTYLVDLATHASRRIGEPLYRLTVWGRGSDRFLGVDDGVFVIPADGEPRQVLDSPAGVSVSPDRDKVVLFPTLDPGPVQIFNAVDNTLMLTFSGEVTCVLWSPDSTSFLLVSNESLFSIPSSGGSPRVVDEDLLADGHSCPVRVVGN